MALKPIQILINAKDEASSVFDKLQTKVAAVGAAILGYFGIQAFSGIVSSAADFEQAMSRVQAATGASADEMGKLRAAAEAASAGTQYSTVETAAALENLAKAGLDATQAIQTLPAAMQLAQAGDIALADSAEFLTKAVMGMGLAFSDAGKVADVLALGANATNTSVTGLAQALSYAAPVASSLGLSLESTVGIIGKFADAGIDASRAGTALNSILSQFSNPAGTFRRELAAAGITTTDFEEALHQLAAAGPGGQRAILAVGQEAGPALRALLGQGMGALDELIVKLRDAEGSAAATAATMQNNLHGAMNGLRSVWAILVQKLGTPVLPAVQEGVQRLTNALRSAVDSGLVTRFGEAMATAFKAAVEWATKFAGSIDFEALVVRLSNFATSAQETFTQVGQYATNAGNIVKTAYGVMSGGANLVLSAIYKIGEGFATVSSGIMTGIAMLREALASMTFGSLSEGFKLAAQEAREAAGGFSAAADALAAKASAAFIAASDGAQLARDGFAGLTEGANAAAAGVESATKSWADYVKESEAAAAANAAMLDEIEKTIGTQQAAAAQAGASAAALADLRAEYEQAISTGNVQRAAEVMKELQRNTDAAARSAQGNARAQEQAAAEVAAAFERAGIKTKAALQQAAESARQDYELIKASGQANAQDLATAWQRAAQAAIDAAGGIAPSWVQAQADAAGYTTEIDEAGKATLRLKEATDLAGGAASGAAGDYDQMGRSAKGAADNIDYLNRVSRGGGGSGGPGPGGRRQPGGSPGGAPGGKPADEQPKDWQTRMDERNAAVKSQYGNTREERLAGQNAVDNTLMFALRDKLNAGLLTDADLPALRAVLAANAENAKIARSMGPSGWSNEGRADWTAWQNTMRLFEQQVSRLGGGGAGPAVGKRVDMRINVDGSDTYQFQTDEQGEDEVERLLRRLKQDKKRSARR